LYGKLSLPTTLSINLYRGQTMKKQFVVFIIFSFLLVYTSSWAQTGLNGIPVGSTTPSTGKFTNLEATTDFKLGSDTVTSLDQINDNKVTTQGDLLSHDGTNESKLDVGADGEVLTADSTAPNGLKWDTAPTGPTGDTGPQGPQGATGATGPPGTSYQFRGALVWSTTDQTVPHLTDTNLAWQSEIYDTDNLHAPGSNFFKIPAGVSRVRLSGGVVWDSTPSGSRAIFTKVNNLLKPVGRALVFSPKTTNFVMGQNIHSAVIVVNANDEIRLVATQDSGQNVVVHGNNEATWFAIEILQ
jgi:hypothetical protein